MTYLKIVLTVIAVLLTVHLVKPFIVSDAQAKTAEVIDVNIISVAGQKINTSLYQGVYSDIGIPVYLTK